MARTAAVLALAFFGRAMATEDMILIAPAAPASGWDQIAQALRLGIVETSGFSPPRVVNVPGGSGTVGLSQFAGSVSNSELMVTGLTMLDAALLNRSPVTLDRLTPVARVAAEPFAVVVPAAGALRNVDDLRAAMARGRVNWAGGPIGGLDHIAAILLHRAAGLLGSQPSYVPFLTSAEAARAVAEERVAAAILPVGEIEPMLAEARLAVLATTGPQRVAALPVPTLTEAGTPLVFSNWRGLLARSGIGEGDRARLEATVARAISAPAWRALQTRRGWTDAFLGGDAFGALIRDDQIRIKEALKSAGILKREMN